MASLASRAATRLSRAVHIKVSPVPANLSESREVLRALQEYGDVVLFKNLRYEPGVATSTMLAMFRTEASVQKLLHESPVFFTLDPLPDEQEATPIDGLHLKAQLREQRRSQRITEALDANNNNTLAEEMISTSRLLYPRERQENSKYEAEAVEDVASSVPVKQLPGRQQTRSRTFRLMIDMSKTDHQDHVNNREPYSAKFITRPNLIQNDLVQSVPLSGLSEVSFSSNRHARFRRKDRFEVDQMPSLGELWQKGIQRDGSKGVQLPKESPWLSDAGLQSADTAKDTQGSSEEGWGLGASFKRTVEDVGKLIADQDDASERKRKYGD